MCCYTHPHTHPATHPPSHLPNQRLYYFKFYSNRVQILTCPGIRPATGWMAKRRLTPVARRVLAISAIAY